MVHELLDYDTYKTYRTLSYVRKYLLKEFHKPNFQVAMNFKVEGDQENSE
jgi:hypothetical protein